MSFFLRIHNKKNGKYLQIVEGFYDKDRKHAVHKSYKCLGYVNDLIASGIKDPISFYKDEVDKLNNANNDFKTQKINETSTRVNVGHFLLKAMLDKLNVDQFINLMTVKYPFRFNVSSFIRQLIYSRIIHPCSLIKTVEEVFPSLYNYEPISVDQAYSGIEYIGADYKKFIELFNYQIARTFGRKTDTVYFDCTNYYFEIDLPKDDKQKGPSKENKSEPIIGQALLLDANQIPIGMEMYPGNESEKPYIRKLVADMKQRYKIDGKTVQVADKGLNCAKNIKEALLNGDGYVFSKSVHGHNLSDVEKKWVLLENDYVIVYGNDGNPKYKIKECIDTFTYKVDGNTYKVKEKRVVSYNYDLAKKQKVEIQKQIDKAISLTSIKSIQREEYGDSVKYVNFDGTCSLNYDKIKEDMELAGYNLIVTSELDKTPQEIYDIYHSLWRIEESFRITKSYLDARPVYLQKKESIYGHFLICYLSLVILRLLEMKVFDNKLCVGEIVDFIRDYELTNGPLNTYINNAHTTKTLDYIQKKLNLISLNNLYFKNNEIEKVYQTKF